MLPSGALVRLGVLGGQGCAPSLLVRLPQAHYQGAARALPRLRQSEVRILTNLPSHCHGGSNIGYPSTQ